MKKYTFEGGGGYEALRYESGQTSDELKFDCIGNEEEYVKAETAAKLARAYSELHDAFEIAMGEFGKFAPDYEACMSFQGKSVKAASLYKEAMGE
jgi:hypothetical protein